MHRHERKRFMREMVDEMQAWLGNHEARQDSRLLTEDTDDDGLDALIHEERGARVGFDTRWWI